MNDAMIRGFILFNVLDICLKDTNHRVTSKINRQEQILDINVNGNEVSHFER